MREESIILLPTITVTVNPDMAPLNPAHRSTTFEKKKQFSPETQNVHGLKMLDAHSTLKKGLPRLFPVTCINNCRSSITNIYNLYDAFSQY